MSTGQKLVINSTSLSGTLKIAQLIGQQLKGGEVIELISDLGGGKTTFVKGLAKGMGSKGIVNSPTFTLENEYKSPELTLHHFDFYRLQKAGLMSNELAEVLEDSKNVAAIEWAEPVHKVLPNKKLSVYIKNTGENSRQFVIECPENLRYLLSGLNGLREN